MKFHHVIFTRFAIKNIFGRDINVHNDDYISSRLTLLKIFCLPAIQSQSLQDFSWVIVVDDGLPESWVAELKQLMRKRARSFIIKYPGNQRASDTTWISHLIPRDTEYLTTSYLDDDDSVPENFVEQVRHNLYKSHSKKCLNPMKIIAFGQTIQWDMIFSEDAPFGYRCPWHRQGVQATSCGFSLCCKYPELGTTVFGMRHRAAFNYLSFDEGPRFPDIADFRERLIRRCDSMGLRFEEPHTDNWSDISRIVGPALASNHMTNSEANRIVETKPAYLKVEGRGSFSEFAIDWIELMRNIEQFKTND